MTITQFLPQWLRRAAQKPARLKPRYVSMKDRQILPTLPQMTRPPARFQDDNSPAGCRISWRF